MSESIKHKKEQCGIDHMKDDSPDPTNVVINGYRIYRCYTGHAIQIKEGEPDV